MKRRILLLLIIIKEITCEQAFPSPCIGSGVEECQSKAHGKYPDCDDCRKFVTCLFHLRVDRICTIPGTFYDRISGDCRHDIACGGDSLDLVPATSTTASTTTTLITIPTSTTTTNTTTSTSLSAKSTSKPTFSTTSSITSTNIPSTSSTTSTTSPSTTSPSTTSQSTASTASTSSTTTTTPPTTTTTSHTTTAFISTTTNLAARVLRVFDPILPTVTTSSTTSRAITTPTTTTLSSQGVPAVNSFLNALPSALLVQGPTTSITTTTTNTSLPMNHDVLQVKTTSAASNTTTTLTNTSLPLNLGVLQAKTTSATPITTTTISTTQTLNHDVVKATKTSATTTTPQPPLLFLSAQDDLFGQLAIGQSTTEASASAGASDPLSIGDIPTTTSSPVVAPRGQITTSKYVHKDNGIRLVQQYGPRVFSSPCLALLDSCLHRTDGQYPSCNTCSTRVICRSGFKFERWCPSGTLYDRYVGRCRSWELVKCFGI